MPNRTQVAPSIEHRPGGARVRRFVDIAARVTSRTHRCRSGPSTAIPILAFLIGFPTDRSGQFRVVPDLPAPMMGAYGDGSVTWTVQLPADTSAAQIARQFVHEHQDHLPEDVVADAKLLVTELVSNAVRHGSPEICLHLRLEPPGIGIAVSDEGDLFTPQRGTAGPADTGGRGLHIVDALSSSWGISSADPAETRKAVWFDLRRDPPS